ncbi:MAG: rhomboid family intramembrane serine protease [Terracidiphilus sp.]|jgi:membrane associated rhomboid family serine protease
MARFGSTSLAFPEFRGATRRLVLWNLSAYFLLVVAQLLAPGLTARLIDWLSFTPSLFLHGYLLQPITYSLVHLPSAIIGTAFDLLALWFLAGFLEGYHNSTWVTGLYAISVFGTAAAATAIYSAGLALGHLLPADQMMGCFGGTFGLLVAIGVLYGDVQFMLFPLPIAIKARYLVIVYALIYFFMLLISDHRVFAFAMLGGGLTGMIYIRLAPRRGVALGLSERWYGLRNNYYRWKRRRAARKFEVYMRSQGRNVRLDSKGRQIDDDPNDKSHWN